MPQADTFVRIDSRAATPPHAQIFEQLRAAVERGALQPGDALPSVRQLADDLGVAANTVARAYADLKLAGYVAGEERRPARVVGEWAANDRNARPRALSEAVARFLATLASRGYAADEIAGELRRRLPALER